MGGAFASETETFKLRPCQWPQGANSSARPYRVKIMIAKRRNPDPRRGGVATDESAADSRADVRIGRSSLFYF
eukprot:739737-Pleurochrysis_carterae.AAC.2